MVEPFPSTPDFPLFRDEKVKHLFSKGGSQIKNRIFPKFEPLITTIFYFSKDKNTPKNSSEAVVPLKLKLKKVILR